MSYSPKSSFYKKIAWIAAILIVLVLAVPYFIDINNYREYFAEQIEKEIGHRVTIKNLRLFIGLGVGVQGKGFVVYARDDKTPLFLAKKIVFYFAPLELLHKRLLVNSFSLTNPRITIIKGMGGEYNIKDAEIEKPTDKKEPVLHKFSIKKFKIRDGEIHFVDLSAIKNNISITGFRADVAHFNPQRGFSFSSRFTVSHPKVGIIGKFKIKSQVLGKLQSLDDLEQIRIDGVFDAESFDLSVVEPILSPFLDPLLDPVSLEKGLINITGKIKGYPLGDFKMVAEVDATNVEVAYPELYDNHYLKADDVSAKVDVICHGPRADIIINDIRVRRENVDATGFIAITDILNDNIAIDLDMGLSSFSTDFAKEYIPYKVIPEGINRFIKDMVVKGKFKKVKVKLKGMIDDIDNIDVPGNEGVLQVSGFLKNGKIKLPDQSGFIDDIVGSIQFAEGNLYFERIFGFLNGLPLDISDFRIDSLYQTAQYHLKGQLPVFFDNRWLKKKLDTLAFLSLSGTGKLSIEFQGRGESFTARGLLDLKESAYFYSPWIKKRKDKANLIKYDLTYKNESLEFKRLSYELDKINKFVLDNTHINLAKEQYRINIVEADIDSAGLLEYSDVEIFRTLQPSGKISLSLEAVSQKDNWQLSGSVNLTDTQYHYKSWLIKPKRILNKCNFSLTITPDNFLFNSLKYQLNRSWLDGGGSVINPEDSSYSLNLVGPVTSNTINDYLKVKFLKGLKPTGTAHLDLQLHSEGERTVLSGKLDLTELGYNYQSIFLKKIGTENDCDLKIAFEENDTVSFKDITFRLEKSWLKIPEGQIDLNDPYTTALELNTLLREKNLTENLSFSFIEKLSLTGDVGAEIKVHWTSAACHLSGNLDLAEAGYSFSDFLIKPAGFSNEIEFQLFSYEEDKWLVEQVKYCLNDSSISLTGSIEDLDESVYDLSLQMDSSDLADLYPVISSSYTKSINPPVGKLSMQAKLEKTRENTRDSFKIKITDARISMKNYPITLYKLAMELDTSDGSQYDMSISSGSVSYQEMILNKIKTDITYTPSHLSICTLDLKTCGGTFSGNGDFYFPSSSKSTDNESDPIEYKFKFDLKDANVKNFLRGLRMASYKRISGKLDFNGSLQNKNSEGVVTEHPWGNLNLSITEGVIKKYDILSKLLYLVNPDSFIIGGSDLVVGGLSYDNIKGTFEVKEGIFHTEDLLLESNVCKILVIGDVDYPREELDLQVFVQPFRMVDSVIEAIPLIGRIIKGKNRGVLDACFSVKGPHKDPEITSQQIKGLMDRTMGIIQRFISLPFDLYKESTSPNED